MRAPSLRALVLAALVAIVACGTSGDSTVGAGDGCTLNSDCNAPLICTFSLCHAQCGADRDCPHGQRCVAGDPPTHVCQLPGEAACAHTSDCPLGLVCAADLQCRTECLADGDCVSGQVCVDRSCADPAELVDGGLPNKTGEPGTPCVFDSECPTGMHCRHRECVFDCMKDIDCPPGFDCSDHVCRPIKTPPPCVPGQQTQCDCAGPSTHGVHVCQDDLTWGPCTMCMSGTGGMGGVGPGSSSSGMGGAGPGSSSSGLGGASSSGIASSSSGLGGASSSGMGPASSSSGFGGSSSSGPASSSSSGFGGSSSSGPASSSSSGPGLGGFGGMGPASSSSGPGAGGFGG